MGFSVQGLNRFVTSKATNAFWQSILPEGVGKAHESGAIHNHDMGDLAPYCVGWDLKDLLLVGFRGAEGKTTSKPAKHFRSALGQIVNFVYTLQGEAAGAQALSVLTLIWLLSLERTSSTIDRLSKESRNLFLMLMYQPGSVSSPRFLTSRWM